VYGYLNDTRPQPQTFQPDDIVVLSDAFCGSTCAVFAEFLKSQAGVHAISVGGRKQYGPMQWVGGSKGANVQVMSDFYKYASEAYDYATPEQQKLFGDWETVKPNIEQALTRLGSGAGRVNFENNIRAGDDSLTPLQYVYEAADCRFFYTAPMISDQSLVWERTHQLRWGNGTCVQGSTGQPSSVTGNSSTYIDSPPPPSAGNTFGANETWSYPGADQSTTSSVTILPSTVPAPSTTSPSISTTSSAAPISSHITQPFTGAASARTISLASAAFAVGLALLTAI
jgi:hypothetical protein